MNGRQLPGGDTEPWYRQFWPWFLILLPACVVVASVSTLVIANRHADDLVADNYYKDGLAINRQLEKKQRGIEQGISARLTLGTARISVEITGPVPDAQLQMVMSHPLEAEQDFTITLVRGPSGRYTAILPRPVSPGWHWNVEQAQPGGWRLDGSVAAADIGNVPIN